MCKTGHLTSNFISHELQNCDFGVSTTPFDVIGKSGATAAMLEHGLPVLTYDDGDNPLISKNIHLHFNEQIFLINDASSIEKLFQYLEKPRKSFFDGITYTTNRMLEIIS